ncbi:MAG: homoserine dehydrogenase [Ruminococcaceae bacterium]|nr:homoserine dehydrogenase [Oscillospiraceae bacterium]
MKELKLALLGFGNAGRAFARLLLEKQEEIEARWNTRIVVTAIATGSRGNLTGQIQLQDALNQLEQNGKFTDPTPCSTMDIVINGDYDVLVEMTPLNIHTGQPAIDHIRGALLRRKHVITANKGPIAWAYDQLQDLARQQGCGFYYETTVMDGTPVFNLTEHTLKLAKVTEVSGILNTTTNYILEELAAGKAYDDIIAAGRKLGFIEADAAMDIEGYDAAAKITALLNVLMQAHITPDQVDRTGIEHITEADIQDAAARGKVIKLLCRGWREDGRVHASVRPVEVDRGDLLAAVDSTSSLVSITTDLMGKLSILEHDPLIEQTAYGVFGDLLRVLEEQ